MTESECYEVLSPLIVETTGWDERSIESVVTRMLSWSDQAAAVEAMTSVVDSWAEARRPPWAVLSGAYRDAARRRALTVPAIEPGADGLPVSFAEGRRIAARAYKDECRRRDPATDVHIKSGFRSSEPNERFLDKMLGIRRA